MKSALLERLNRDYARLHTAKEDAFWTAQMGLADDAQAAQRDLDEKEVALQRFLRDPGQLAAVRAEQARVRDPLEKSALGGWEATFRAHAIESAEARALAEETVAAEGRLARARGDMPLGYRHPERGFVRASSVELGTLLRSEPDERVRRAAWEGLRSIEPYVLEHGFLDLLRRRNRLARLLGAEDFYDWKTRRVERMTKLEVFARLDELEERTRASAEAALAALRARHGAAAVRPWSIAWLTAGDTVREQDPYFPFAQALERWGRSFAAMGIDYRGATLVLDLVDRRGKYENGFMHGPEIAWREHGVLHPARIHFTANAIPGMVGSGQRAMETLFHEGGHAAHFANVDMPAPCFGQEFAPTSIGFSETQSMLLDSLLGDADWMSRYALDAGGRPMPWELVERGIRATQPHAAWQARAMLAVCYAERALYELPDSALTAESVLATLRDVERELCFLDEGSPRPTLAVPHLLADDSSAYYHGYVLAEMAVHQTRRFFEQRDGHLVDNPRLGPDLALAYWRPGNSLGFDAFLARLTGRPLGAADLARHLLRTPDEAVAEARAAVAALEHVPRFEGPVQLNAKLRVVHGRETVTELENDDFSACAGQFARWIESSEARAERRGAR
jgi:hypothetical protein